MAAPAAFATFNQLVAESFTLLAVTGAHFWMAAKFVDQHTLGLHAVDALQLATASHHGATVPTRYQHLAEAGSVLGAIASMIRVPILPRQSCLACSVVAPSRSVWHP